MISAIVTTYNRPDLVREAIDSALAQTYEDLEVIVVDDGSTDETPEVLASYGDRIRVVTKPNGGVASARNAGIRASSGELLAFLDDDDIWLPEKTAVQAAYMAEHPEIGICYTDCARFNEHGELGDPDRKPLTGRVFTEFVENYFIIFSTIVVPRAAIDRVGMFDEEYLRQDDLDFMARILEHYPAGYVDEKLIRRRKYARPITPEQVRRSATEQAMYIDKLVARYGGKGVLPRSWEIRKRWSVEMKLGRAEEMQGRAAHARGHYARAMRLRPFRLRAYRRWLQAPRKARKALERLSS